MQKTQINPAIFQTFLESASNAAAKGQAQYFTPTEWGKALSAALPRFRPTVVDLHCGAGHLLRACARGSTERLLGCDIEPCDGRDALPRVPDIPFYHFTADVTRAYALMRAVDLQADCFVLNPPWDLHQYREPIARLARSELPTVRAAFANHDDRCGQDTIDSTVAALLIALDRCSKYGEGFLIANESTLQRLLLGETAPHRAAALHCWSHLVIEGNICTAPSEPSSIVNRPSTFHTGVIFFARDHDTGLPPAGSTLYQPPVITSAAHCLTVCNQLHKERLDLRQGAEIKSYAHSDTTTDQWLAVAEEWNRLHPAPNSALLTPHFNLWLSANGNIATNLSLFDEASHRVTKAEADDLFSLNGKHPMQLVMQRTHRAHLERAAFGQTWRVDPKLQAAIKTAVIEYHSIRAPLYPLSPIQRLGYLDEQETIVCSRDLGLKTESLKLQTCFKADLSYPIRSTTVAVKRSGEKLNIQGGLDEVEWDGQELAFFITDDLGIERVFMEGRLRAKNICISLVQPGVPQYGVAEPPPFIIDFTLHELVEHFVIPDVPDVARVNPEGYQRNVQLLHEIEALTV